ncbi:MAG: PD40 domain-containing protein, partial [Planctomycetales bacterium]|nr:PD40 domain-containing protein [Planctomycetales bacterium]
MINVTKLFKLRRRGCLTHAKARINRLAVILLTLFVGATSVFAQATTDATDSSNAAADAQEESRLLTGIRQLTFEGKRAGEGYFSRDGQMMVFQSERDAANPFYQIYLMDFATGDIERISPGIGKTTCAWIHPDGNEVLFASTQDDPQAKDKQAAELKEREQGTQRRYAWDYDEYYDLYRYDRKQKTYTNVTNTRGYDAEGSWSPNGKLIAFASNRAAYAKPLSETMRQRLEMDPSYFIDLYSMDADGGNIRQLTDMPGYDGGPFFSPDGTRICWRRFSEDGARAEIMSMALDGSDVRTLTKLGAMSWAPYYHPSGQYLIFTTNVHGFANFELYLIDALGQHEPVRVTFTDGFDGLPVFNPDGKQLSWTSNRTPGKNSQIFLAEWNHQHALELLGLAGNANERPAATVAALDSLRASQPDCSPQDILRHVDYLCRPELRGRR